MTDPNRVAVLLFFAGAALYVGFARGVFVFGDDISMFRVTESIVERGSVEISVPRFSDLYRHGSTQSKGPRFSKYGLGQSLWAIPFYLAAKATPESAELPSRRDPFGSLRAGNAVFGTSLAGAIAGALAMTAFLFLGLEWGFSLRTSATLAALLGTATLLFHYSTTFLSEPLSALLIVLAVTFALRAESRARADGRFASAAILSGFFSGLVVLTKVAHLVVVAPLAILIVLAGARGGHHQAGFWRRLRAGAKMGAEWLTGALPGAAAVAAYNYARFGTVFETGYGREAIHFNTPLRWGAAGLLISPGRGMLLFSPILILAILALPRFLRDRPFRSLFVVLPACCLGLLMAKFYEWHGGGCWGPRLVVPVMPLLLLPAGSVLETWHRRGRVAKFLIAGVAAMSIYAAALPLFVPFDTQSSPLSAAHLDFTRAAWKIAESPLLFAVRESPNAASMTIEKLAGAIPIDTTRDGLSAPDAAFVKYESRSLLNFSRVAICIALGAAIAAARLSAVRAASKPQVPGSPAGSA